MITSLVQKVSTETEIPRWRMRIATFANVVAFWWKHLATIQMGITKDADSEMYRVHIQYCALFPDDVDQIILDYATILQKKRALMARRSGVDLLNNQSNDSKQP